MNSKMLYRDEEKKTKDRGVIILLSIFAVFISILLTTYYLNVDGYFEVAPLDDNLPVQTTTN